MTFESLNYIDTNNNFLIISPLDINRLTPVLLYDIAKLFHVIHLILFYMYEIFRFLSLSDEIQFHSTMKEYI